MDCPFCAIEREKQRLLETGEHSFVILSNPRLMPGHTLVIPKRHVLHIGELHQDEIQEIFRMLVTYEQKILKTIAPGCDIRQNYRPFVTQSRLKVDHVHFHLQPRSLDDDLHQRVQKFERDVFQDLSSEEEQRIKRLFR